MNIPDTLDEITPPWLSDVLNTNVTDCRIVDSHSGTTGRGVLEVEYATATDLPARLFVKLPPDDKLQRAFVCANGMGRREAMFYQQLAGEVPIRVPRSYYSACDESGERYIMLLEHLEDSACTFHNASNHYSIDYIRSVLTAFAKLHACYWHDPRFDGDLTWVQKPIQHTATVDLVASALQQFATEMPPVFTSMAELYIEQADVIHSLWSRGDATLIHGDVHDGNLFLDGKTPGFLDWALLARGTGMRDVAYFLAGTMSVQDRELEQGNMLVHYRDTLLHAGIDAPDIEQLWQEYRWHAAYVWVGAAVTLAMGDAWQPVNYTRKSLQRINRALEDLGSVEAIRKAL